MLGEQGTEQFTVTTRVDDKLIREQKIHDPFIFNTTIIGISWWEAFKSLFRRDRNIKVTVNVSATHAAMSKIMCLDPVELQAETDKWFDGPVATMGLMDQTNAR